MCVTFFLLSFSFFFSSHFSPIPICDSSLLPHFILPFSTPSFISPLFLPRFVVASSSVCDTSLLHPLILSSSFISHLFLLFSISHFVVASSSSSQISDWFNKSSVALMADRNSAGPHLRPSAILINGRGTRPTSPAVPPPRLLVQKGNLSLPHSFPTLFPPFFPPSRFCLPPFPASPPSFPSPKFSSSFSSSFLR